MKERGIGLLLLLAALGALVVGALVFGPYLLQ